jgi:hypothetical protein
MIPGAFWANFSWVASPAVQGNQTRSIRNSDRRGVEREDSAWANPFWIASSAWSRRGSDGGGTSATMKRRS